MPPSQKVVVVLEVRASKKIDAELTKAKSKVKGWAATLTREMKNVFKRATFFRFSTIGINSFFNSIRFARQEAIAFQDALGDIVKVDLNRFIDLNSKATRKLSDDISRLANEYGILRVEAAQTLQAITVAGFRGAEAMKVLDAALLGQSATGLKAAKVFKAILLPSILQFGVGVDQLESALDVLVTTQANAAVGFEDFAGAFRAGGATLAGTTRSLNEAAALVAALGEVTQESGATVGTFFKTLSPRLLANPGAKRVLETFKVDVVNPQTGALKSTGEVLVDLNRNMIGLGAGAKRYNLSVVSGIRQGNRLIAVMNALAKVEELVELNSRAAGDTRRRVAVEQQKISVKWRKVQNEFAQSLEKSMLPVMDDLIVAARDIARFGAGAINTLIEVGQSLGIISKASPEEKRQLSLVRQIEGAAKNLSDAGVEAVNKQILSMAVQVKRFSIEEARQIARGAGFDPGIIGTAIGRLAENITGQTPVSSQRAITNLDQLSTIYSELLAGGFKFAQGFENTQQQIGNLQTILAAVRKRAAEDKKAGLDPRITTDLPTGLAGPDNQGSQFRSVLKTFNTALREGGPAKSIKEFQVRLTNAFAAINNPVKSFNRGLLQQRKTLVQVNQERKIARDKALATAEEQAKIDLQGLDAGAKKALQEELQLARDKSRVEALKDQVKLAEFDAKAMRRLNTELNSMKDKSKDAASKLSTSTRRLNELRIEEAKAATAVAKATISMKDALIEYEIGLLRAQLESKKITGEVGSLAQELAGSKKIIPLFLEGLTKELQQPSRVGGGFGGDNIIKGELKLSNLRRESLRQQLDLTQQILNRQREIGESFFSLDAGGRNQLAQGLGAIQNLFGRFGGDVGAVRGLSSQDLNAFGRQLLGLPDDVKESILRATEFIPEGATVAGFTGKQIRDIIAQASLGRADGTGILDIGALQEEAADATTKLAELQTDALVNSIEQLNVAQQQLDQQKAQTEVARIQVEVARQQLAALTSEQGTRRAGIMAEMDFIRRQNRPTGPAMGTNAVLGRASMARIQAFQTAMTNILDLAQENLESGRGTAETMGVLQERYERFNQAIKENDTSIAALNEGFLKMGRTVTSLNQLFEQGRAADLAKVGSGTPGFAIAKGKAAGSTTQVPVEKALLDLIEVLRPLTGEKGFNSQELGVMIKNIEAALANNGGRVPTEVLIKLAGETIEKLEITGLAELPAAMADVVKNHPDVKDSATFIKNLGVIIRAMVEAGIGAGAFPPNLRAQLPSIPATGE